MTALILPSHSDIRQYARGALAAASALDATPVSLDDVTAAIGLHPAEDLFGLGDDVPPKLLAIIRKLRGKVAGALAFSERTVYLDAALNYERRRFTHGHELGHQALPWHKRSYLADDHHTLSADTRDLLEQEANAFSAELLFGLDRFTEQADSNAPGLAGPLELSQNYRTSAHAALRRYVELSRHPVALLVLGRINVTLNGKAALKVIPAQCVQSIRFLERWGALADLAPDRFVIQDDNPAVQVAVRLDRGLAAEPTTLTLLETRRGPVTFDAEVFDNGRLRFVLLYRRRPLNGRRLRVAQR